mmetsp:Transcript_142541/g.261979  ORF Transcript_142541/g.261979 Transcript_142541/m.261979 type:complete len:439 (+) Transcript_142541:110-1426(+)
MANGYEPVATDEESKGGGCALKCCLCCCCVLVLVIWGILPFALGNFVGYGIFVNMNPLVWEYSDQTPATIPQVVWYPGCDAGFKNASTLAECTSPCFSPDLVLDIAKFNENHKFFKVTYPSRKDPSSDKPTNTLKGWLLPCDETNLPNGTACPRVVLSHGFTSNALKHYITLHSYNMRSMGFTVLANNLHDHGISPNTSSTPINTWGYDYHLDLLGAWDYLRNDPDGLVGGKVPSSKVGIMGFSMGAFITLNAFTLDKDIPAAWCDSPPSTPKDVFLFGASQSPIPMVPQLFALPGVGPLAFAWMNSKSGVDLEKRNPLNDIPTGPDGKRPIQIATNLKDNTVPAWAVKSIVQALRDNPDKYDVAEPYYVDGMCNENNHLVAGLMEPDVYRQKLCAFWTAALDVPASICGLGDVTERRMTSAVEGKHPAVDVSSNIVI